MWLWMVGIPDVSFRPAAKVDAVTAGTPKKSPIPTAYSIFVSRKPGPSFHFARLVHALTPHLLLFRDVSNLIRPSCSEVERVLTVFMPSNPVPLQNNATICVR